MNDKGKDFVYLCSQRLPIAEPIYEFGSYQVIGQEYYADLRGYFPNREYVGCDKRNGRGVDKIVDLEDTHLPNKSVGTAICIETIEHTPHPWVAVSELWRILKPDGILILSTTPQDFTKDHCIKDQVPDYFNFTPLGLKSMLLEKFNYVYIANSGYTVVAIAGNTEIRGANKLLSQWQDKWQDRDFKGIQYYLRQIVPPCLTRLAYYLYIKFR